MSMYLKVPVSTITGTRIDDLFSRRNSAHDRIWAVLKSHFHEYNLPVDFAVDPFTIGGSVFALKFNYKPSKKEWRSKPGGEEGFYVFTEYAKAINGGLYQKLKAVEDVIDNSDICDAVGIIYGEVNGRYFSRPSIFKTACKGYFCVKIDELWAEVFKPNDDYTEITYSEYAKIKKEKERLLSASGD